MIVTLEFLNKHNSLELAKLCKKLIDDTNELYMYFDPSTGKINNVVYGTTSADIGSGIGYISIKRNDYVISLKVFYNTCKCERE